MNTIKGVRLKWAEVFEDPSLTQESLRARAVSQHANLGIDGIRSICWKVYLSCLPSLDTSSWPYAMSTKREQYKELRKKYIRSIGSDDGVEPDLEVNNPLSLAKDSPWQQFFVDSELRKVIKQDVDRTLPDNDFFRSEKVQEQLNDILFIYCKINSDVSYRQGMHELVAHILWVVSSESLDAHSTPSFPSDPTIDIIKNVLDADSIEHDSFTLFSALMSRAKPWYEFSDDTMVSRKPKIPNANSHTQLFGRAESPEPTPGKQTPVIEWSRKIFYYLEKIDNELYLHLKNLDIQPQLFGIRWFRLLFGREFPMEDVLTIWDGIFAQDPNLEICIFIGLALLLRIRDDLLQEDFAGCLHKLMRYPSVKDVHLFISQGLSLQKQPNAIGGLEVIRQNNALTGKPLPPLPYESDSEHAGHDHLQQRHQRSGVSPTYTQQSHHHQKQDHQQQQSYPYDHAKGQNPSFSGSGVFSQHLPPAALDAIKPVAEGFVHVTKNVLESKGGAALNKALSDMKKNTQSYIRKVNSPVQSPSPSPFPPIFDQANVPSSRLVASTQPVHHSPMEQEYQDANGSNTVGFTDKQLQLQLGQIVAKAMAILETELRTPDQSNSVLMMPSKATQAAMSGLEHVRDFLLGSSKDLDLLVIESKMLETSTNINDESGVHEVAHSTTKPTLPSPNASTQTDTRSGTTTKVQRKPINAIAATTRINSPTPIRAESPRRSSSDLHSQRGSLSRTLSHSSAIGTEFSADRGYKYDQNTPPVTPPIAKSYVPSPPSSLSAPKPFSFDDLIDDTTTTGPVRSSSPSISATKGVGSSNLGYKVKSPRSSLVNSQFSWMLNDDNSISSSSSSNITKTASPSASISSLPKSGASSGVQRSTPDTFSPSPTPSHRINIDPLAGNVSKQNVSASSAATSGITITHQQLQEDDPLRL